MEKLEEVVKKMELEGELPVPDDEVTYWNGGKLYLYGGFWLGSFSLPSFIPFHNHFQALDSDVVLATFPKCGTTWLKALAFSILNRTHYKDDTTPHPLLSSTPQTLVSFLENLYRNNLNPLLDHPRHDHGTRLFATHFPLTLLSPSVCSTKCRIIYICRNPLDQFISSYIFFLKVSDLESRHDELLDEAFDLFCRGIHPAGPLWSHALEYWKMSIERPDKVLFLKYEDVKEDTVGHVRRMAEFLGCPFSPEEERGGVIGDIVNMCSFKKLKEIDVNKTGKSVLGYENSAFFRKGEVGDWANYLTPAMAERARRIVEAKLAGSGLTFNLKKNCK